MKQIYFICNLHSGRASVGTHLAMILDRFTAAGYQVTVHPTQERGDAIERAKEACHMGFYDLLVCSGGDGTLNEVIQGCMASETPLPIGYIPFGSTNDFARGIGIPMNPEEAVDCIIHGETIPFDIGGFNNKFFTYVAAFGAFTEISYQTSQQFKNLLGHVAYILNGISQLPKIRSYRMRIEYDGGVIEDDFLYGMVTNSSSVAHFLALSDIRWDDGLFEVTLIRKPANIVELHQLVAEFSKIQIGFGKRNLHYFRTSKLSVTCLDEEPVSWTIDGEFGGTNAVNQIRNIQKAVSFYVDPACRARAEGAAGSGFAIVMPPKSESLPQPAIESLQSPDAAESK